MPYKWKTQEELPGDWSDRVVESSIAGGSVTISEHVSAIQRNGMCCHMNDFKMHSDKYLLPDSDWSEADKDKLIAHRRFATKCCKHRGAMDRLSLENLNNYFIALMQHFNANFLESFPEEMDKAEIYEHVKDYLEE